MTNATQDRITIAALYQFRSVADPEALVTQLQSLCQSKGTLGTLLVAEEGINGTICGDSKAIQDVIEFLIDAGFDGLELKYSYAAEPVFYRMKVKRKSEIVTMGIDGVSPVKEVGHYVEPQQWNELISDPDTLVIDTRNDYEYRIGTFEGAIDPKTDIFREFPTWIDERVQDVPIEERPKKIAMFCTGGIRCEKSTAYLREQGFDNVYHLKGGILAYLEQVPEAKSLWQGECFVFDHRVSVQHGVQPGSYDLCHGCREPISEQDKLDAGYEEGVSCGRCVDRLSDAQKASFRERQRQIQLAKARGEGHIAVTPQKQDQG